MGVIAIVFTDATHTVMEDITQDTHIRSRDLGCHFRILSIIYIMFFTILFLETSTVPGLQYFLSIDILPLISVLSSNLYSIPICQPYFFIWMSRSHAKLL